MLRRIGAGLPPPASTLLATMDGLQLRHVLSPHDLRIDHAFAQLVGQMLADLAADTPEATNAVAAWRSRQASGSTM